MRASSGDSICLWYMCVYTCKQKQHVYIYIYIYIFFFFFFFVFTLLFMCVRVGLLFETVLHAFGY